MEDKWVSCVKLNGDKYVLKIVTRDKFGICKSTEILVDKEFILETINYLTDCITK